MNFDLETPQLTQRRSVKSQAQNLLVKAVAIIGAGVLLVSAIAVSLVVFAVAIAALSIFGGYIWWKTRHLRKQLRAHSVDGTVIEGVVIREHHHVKQIVRE